MKAYDLDIGQLVSLAIGMLLEGFTAENIQKMKEGKLTTQQFVNDMIASLTDQVMESGSLEDVSMEAVALYHILQSDERPTIWAAIEDALPNL